MEKIVEKRQVSSPVDSLEGCETGPKAYDLTPVNEVLNNYQVQQVKLSSGITVQDTTPLSEVIAAMKKEKTGCVITQKKSAVNGIFTERDFLKKVIDEDVDWSTPISKFTTPNPVTMKGDEPLKKALYLMTKRNFRHIPIFNQENNLMGVLSVRNIIKLFAEHFPEEVINLPPKLENIPESPEGG